MALDEGAAAALTYLAADPHAFDGGAAASCEAFAATAGKSMRLAVRLGSVQDMNRDLLQAMKSRTIINLASGILMAQSRCSQAEAFTLLSKVSNNRNVKLRLVAEEILRRFEPGPLAADFGTLTARLTAPGPDSVPGTSRPAHPGRCRARVPVSRRRRFSR